MFNIINKETIMKKTYLNPELQVITIETSMVLAASTLSVGEDWTNGEGAARESTLDDED